MNNNIKDTTSLVFVKGKNLFDGVFRQGLHVSYSTANRITNLNSIKSIAGQRYTFSANLPSGYQIKIMNCSSNDINATVLNDTDYTTSSVTVYCGSNGYLKVIVKKTNDENITPIEVSNYNFQIEQNSTATTYEPYVEKQIHIKNKNGVFEEFYNEEKNISTGNANVDSNYINDVEANIYTKIGNVVTYAFTLKTKGTWNTTTIFANNLPKPKAWTRFIALDTSAEDKPMRCVITTNGELRNWYSANTPIANHIIEGYVTYITSD